HGGRADYRPLHHGPAGTLRYPHHAACPRRAGRRRTRLSGRRHAFGRAQIAGAILMVRFLLLLAALALAAGGSEAAGKPEAERQFARWLQQDLWPDARAAGI